jgi:two-component system sensor histidine kinase DegS
VLEQLGLARGLRHLMNELSKGNGIDVRYELHGKVRRIDRDDELVMFRIAQEALTNIRKHSHATKAVLRLEFTRSKVILRVRDNGVGFEVPKAIGDFASTSRLGLIGIRERVELLGGTWKITSRLGEGTSLSVEIPR